MTRQKDESTPQGVSLDRRTWLQAMAGAAAAATLSWDSFAGAAELKGRIHQSVCLWCYNGYMKKANLNLDGFAAACAKLGLKSIELTGPGEWPTLKKHGLICAMVPSHGIGKGLNRVENHEECLAAVRKGIDQAADAGFPNVITFSGNREGLDDQEGLKNCVAGLKKIAGYAEEKKITVCLEYLNSID
nr:hydroxypyruvate isomerase [Pirellulaceae bacterium]